MNPDVEKKKGGNAFEFPAPLRNAVFSRPSLRRKITIAIQLAQEEIVESLQSQYPVSPLPFDISNPQSPNLFSHAR